MTAVNHASEPAGSPSTPQPGAASRLAIVAQIALGLGAAALGVLLFVAPLSPQATAIVTGIGLVVAGLALAFARIDPAPRDEPAPSRMRAVLPWLRRLGGALLIAIGLVMAVWPDAGAPRLAWLVGAGLILHGLISGASVLRGDADHRVSGVLFALASLVFGVLAFSWPVLTLSVFRLAVGAWLVFVGLRLLVQLVLARRTRTHAPGRTPRAPRLRRWARTLGAAASLVIAVALAAGSAWVLGGAPLPEPGSFYTPPAEVPSERGRLIRAEPLTTGVPAGAEAWTILYTTTHPDGSPAVASGTVIAPQDRDGEPLPLLTVAHGTTGVVPKCAPSMSATPFADGAGTALEMMVTQHGWAAVTSDYIGLGTEGPHPYLIGDAEARNVLDASLAAHELDGLALDTRTVVWGHSQGGQGALWTGQVAEEYAPSLTVEGIAAFAPAADLFGLAEADKSEVGGKTVSAYIAATWNEIYPELELQSHLTPGSARGVEKIEQLCFNSKDVIAALLHGTQVPNQVFPDSLLNGAFGDLLKQQTPEGPFPAPVMVAQGLADPLVKPPLQQAWVDARCAAGEAIDYRTFPGLSHNTLVAADSPLTPQIVQWTLDRWNGTAPTPNCGENPVQQ